MAKKYRNRYQLQTSFGVLKHYYGFRHLEPIPDGVLSPIPDNSIMVTLRTAVRATSRNLTGPVRASCSWETACNTKRCGCFKVDRKCTIHYHPKGIGNKNYTNGEVLDEAEDEEMEYGS